MFSFVLMHDFSQRYRNNKVVYFWLWAEEDADVRGMDDAFQILERAARETFDEDVRCEKLNDAIAFLMSNNARNKPLRDFKASLDMADPVQRHQAARHALVRIKLALSQNTVLKRSGSSH